MGWGGGEVPSDAGPYMHVCLDGKNDSTHECGALNLSMFFFLSHVVQDMSTNLSLGDFIPKGL